MTKLVYTLRLPQEHYLHFLVSLWISIDEIGKRLIDLVAPLRDVPGQYQLHLIIDLLVLRLQIVDHGLPLVLLFFHFLVVRLELADLLVAGLDVLVQLLVRVLQVVVLLLEVFVLLHRTKVRLILITPIPRLAH